MNIEFVNYLILDQKEHQKLLEIRNEEYIRKNMDSDEYIQLSDHISWLKTLKVDRSMFYYSVVFDDFLVGGVSLTKLDHKSSTTEIGIFFKNNINPLVSSSSLYLFLEKIFFDLKINKVNIKVKNSNLAAHKFDLSFGFIEYKEVSQDDSEYIKMYLTKENWINKKTNAVFKVLISKIKKINYKWKE